MKLIINKAVRRSKLCNYTPSVQEEKFRCPNCERSEQLKVDAACYVEVLLVTDGDYEGGVADAQVLSDTVDCDISGDAVCSACGYKGALRAFVIPMGKPVCATRRERVEHLINLHDCVPLKASEKAELLRLLISETDVLYPVLDGAGLAVHTEDIHSSDLRVALADYKEGEPHE